MQWFPIKNLLPVIQHKSDLFLLWSSMKMPLSIIIMDTIQSDDENCLAGDWNINTRLDLNTTNYITGFSPHANQRTAHHMLLFGCEEPGRREEVFRSGKKQ